MEGALSCICSGRKHGVVQLSVPPCHTAQPGQGDGEPKEISDLQML